MRGLAASCGSCINVDGAKIRLPASRLKPCEAQTSKTTHFRRYATVIYAVCFLASAKNIAHSPHFLLIIPIRENTGQFCAFHGIYPAGLFPKEQQTPAMRPSSAPLQFPNKFPTRQRMPPKPHNTLRLNEIPTRKRTHITFCFSMVWERRKKV